MRVCAQFKDFHRHLHCFPPQREQRWQQQQQQQQQQQHCFEPPMQLLRR